MNVVAVVAARMGSTRLPGKALADLNGKPMIARVLERAGQASTVDAVVLATSQRAEENVLVETVRALGYRVFRGSESDVLGRMYSAAKWAKADVVVRVTGDCPRAEPAVIDRVVAALDDEADLASNIVTRTYPKGLDVEAMYLDTLARIDRMAWTPEAREHVTWFPYRERPDLFVVRSVEQPEDHSHLNLSVDTQEDLERVRCLT